MEEAARVRLPGNGLEWDEASVHMFSIHDDDPLLAVQRVQFRMEYKRDAWQIRIETDSTLTANANHFHVTNHLDASEGRTRVFAKAWMFTIPRDPV